MRLEDMVVGFGSYFKRLMELGGHEGSGLTAWGRRFVVEFAVAMWSAGDTVLSEVVRRMSGRRETVAQRYDRAERWLARLDLVAVAAEQTTELGKRVGAGFVIALDLSDIAKPESRRLEALGTVWDGSKGGVEKGFGLVTACAVDLAHVERGFPLPLLFESYSTASEEFVSEPAVWLDAIDRLCAATDRRATIAIDRAGDNGRILGRLITHGRDFVVRIKSGEKSRHVQTAKGRRLVSDCWKDGRSLGQVTVERMTDRGERVPYTAEVRSQRVSLPDYPKTPLWLVAYDCDEHEQPMVLLTTHSGAKLRDCVDVLARYWARWAAEEMHRFAKQEFGLERVRTKTWHRTKNMVAMVWMLMGAMAVQALDPKAELVLHKLEVIGQRLARPLTPRQFWGYAWVRGVRSWFQQNALALARFLAGWRTEPPTRQAELFRPS